MTVEPRTIGMFAVRDAEGMLRCACGSTQFGSPYRRHHTHKVMTRQCQRCGAWNKTSQPAPRYKPKR